MSILKEIINHFSSEDSVLAVVLGGSRKNSTADEMSDFDIYVYSKKPISVEFRKELIEKYSENFELDNTRWESGDEFVGKDGACYDIMYRDKGFIEGTIDWVYDKGNASMGYSTACLFNFSTAEILFDRNNWYKNLQDKVNGDFPNILQENIIKKNYPVLRNTISSYKKQIEKAIIRQDFISVNHRITAFLASYFDVIFAINKQYHPGEKKLVKLTKKICPILPKNFEINIAKLLNEKENILTNIDVIIDELEKILFV